IDDQCVHRKYHTLFEKAKEYPHSEKLKSNILRQANLPVKACNICAAILLFLINVSKIARHLKQGAK
ncbi:MAG: hypothetical protein ACE5DN_07830, partial [Flavobacteriales bacterium]